jgi:hypothetical protein
MKNLKPLLAAFMLFVCAASALSQETAPLTEPNYKKPLLFSSLPVNFKANLSALKELLKSANGEQVTADLGDGTSFSFNGQIISTAARNNNSVISVVIRSANYNGATLAFSQVIKEDGTLSYTGRIISFQHGDVLELRQNGDNYEFVKKKFHDLVNE